MIAEYDIILHIRVAHEIDDLETGGHLKSDREMADSIGQMICDEAVTSGGVATYDILDSSFEAK